MADDQINVQQPQRTLRVKRPRSSSDPNTTTTSTTTAGSRGQTGHSPEKLVDKSRRVKALGTTHVDNGASMSAQLAAAVSRKAFLLRIRLKCRPALVISDPCWGQVGLIRAEPLTNTTKGAHGEDKTKESTESAVVSGQPPDKLIPPLDYPRFAVIPTTCINILENEIIDDDVWELYSTEIASPPDNASFEVQFQHAGYTPTTPTESIVLRPGDTEQGEIIWDYYDVTTAAKVDNPKCPLTKSNVSFEKVQRKDFSLQVGQKIGMAVYREFELTADHVGMRQGTITKQELDSIFGKVHRVIVYTGQITRVSPCGQALEHDINSFRGCSGAVIFLLDEEQEGFGVVSADYGKAIAIHVGGRELDNGMMVNFAFKIP